MEDRIMMASRFKAECLAVLDQVEDLKISVTITKHGRPIARLVPLEAPSERPLAGSVRLMAHEDSAYYGTDEAWSAEPGRR
ncbi:MAG: type II toxin-antitoxin system prevent-host-death family antitoxin [Chloroflexota bacterium]